MIVSDRPPFQSLLRIFLLVVFVGWLVIGQGVGLLVGMVIEGDSFLVNMSDPTLISNMKYAVLLSQGVGATVGLVLIPWYYLKSSENRTIKDFFRNDSKWLLVIVAIAISTIALFLIISPIAEWNSNIQFPDFMSRFGDWAKRTEAFAAELTKAITTNLSPIGFILAFIVVGIIPAIGEELVFRGLIQTEFQRAFRNPHTAIWLTAIFFSAMHLQFMGFFPRVLLGAFMGYLYYWSGNLAVPIIAHFFNNGFQVIALYLNQIGIISIDLEKNQSVPLLLLVAATIVIFLILYFLRNHFTSRSISSGDIH